MPREQPCRAELQGQHERALLAFARIVGTDVVQEKMHIIAVRPGGRLPQARILPLRG